MGAHATVSLLSCEWHLLLRSHCSCSFSGALAPVASHRRVLYAFLWSSICVFVVEPGALDSPPVADKSPW